MDTLKNIARITLHWLGDSCWVKEQPHSRAPAATSGGCIRLPCFQDLRVKESYPASFIETDFL